jgi:hypothetical protein
LRVGASIGEDVNECGVSDGVGGGVVWVVDLENSRVVRELNTHSGNWLWERAIPCPDGGTGGLVGYIADEDLGKSNLADVDGVSGTGLVASRWVGNVGEERGSSPLASGLGDHGDWHYRWKNGGSEKKVLPVILQERLNSLSTVWLSST